MGRAESGSGTSTIGGGEAGGDERDDGGVVWTVEYVGREGRVAGSDDGGGQFRVKKVNKQK